MFCFYFRVQQQQLLEYLEWRARFALWDVLESRPGPCSPPGSATNGAQKGGTLLWAPARRQGMGCEGRTFKRGQRCDENKRQAHVCAPQRRLLHGTREHGPPPQVPVVGRSLWAQKAVYKITGPRVWLSRSSLYPSRNKSHPPLGPDLPPSCHALPGAARGGAGRVIEPGWPMRNLVVLEQIRSNLILTSQEPRGLP